MSFFDCKFVCVWCSHGISLGGTCVLAWLGLQGWMRTRCGTLQQLSTRLSGTSLPPKTSQTQVEWANQLPDQIL